MAVKKMEEILESIKAKFEGDTSDETLSLIEDISDTLSDYNTRVIDSTDWKNKYEENDKNWREKYKERFFNSSPDPDDDDPTEDDDNNRPKTFEELFTKEG